MVRSFGVALIAGILLAPSADGASAADKPRVKLTTTHGPIVIELDRDKAPITVDNFLGYVRSGHYDGTVFHRVIRGFMIQGGGFVAGLDQKPTRDPIEN